MGRATRAAAAMRARQLRPFLERSAKAVLQDCDLYGVDHKTYCGATPLMLAARAGNVALIETLLARGADPEIVDDYGHTAWMGALNRAIDDQAFARAHIAELFERLGPETLDVHTDGRLVRLERGQGEFWLLGSDAGRPQDPLRRSDRPAARALPIYARLFRRWPARDARIVCRSISGRKHAARKTISTACWRERRSNPAIGPPASSGSGAQIGYYLPAPDMKLRRKTADGEAWIPIAEALGLAAVSDGGEGRLFDVYALPRAGASAPVG